MNHAAVLLNYNGHKDTIDCINSIKKSANPPHIIVVDNASKDNSTSILKKKFPNLDLIESSKNIGFSAGNNLGIRKALSSGSEVVHILNNDTEVDKNALLNSYNFVHGKDKITGAKIYYAKGYEYHEKQKGKGNILWYAGGYMDWNMAIAKHTGVDEVDEGQHDKIKKVDFITGCYMAVPAQVFKKVGLLDEKFFLYLEDADFILRAAKKGVSAYYNPSIVIYHRNSSTTKSGSQLVDYYLSRNRFLIGKRYGGMKLTLSLIKEALTTNWNNQVKRMAFIDFITNNFGNNNAKIASITKKA